MLGRWTDSLKWHLFYLVKGYLIWKWSHVSQWFLHTSCEKKNKVVGNSSDFWIYFALGRWCRVKILQMTKKSSADLEPGDDKIILIIVIWVVNICYIILPTTMTKDHNFRVWHERIAQTWYNNHETSVYWFSICILLIIEKLKYLLYLCLHFLQFLPDCCKS